MITLEWWCGDREGNGGRGDRTTGDCGRTTDEREVGVGDGGRMKAEV